MRLDSAEIKAIASELENAKDRVRRAIAALAPKHKGGEVEEYRAAHASAIDLERRLALAKGEPHAIPADFPIKWDVGAPLPHLLKSGHRTLLTFYVQEPAPNWDGTAVNVIDPSSSVEDLLCLVTFEGCRSVKFGGPNDEVQHGHPLYERGLEGYTAQIVVNSPWVEELKAINSVHRQFRPERWDAVKHYIFWFHDDTFECLATGLSWEVTRESMPSLIERVGKMLLR